MNVIDQAGWMVVDLVEHKKARKDHGLGGLEAAMLYAKNRLCRLLTSARLWSGWQHSESVDQPKVVIPPVSNPGMMRVPEQIVHPVGSKEGPDDNFG